MHSRKVVAAAAAGLALLAAVLYLAFRTKAPPPPTDFGQHERVIAGSPQDSLEVRHLVLKGTNEEIGRALAQLARERYQAQPRPSQDPARTRAQRRYIEKNFPILHDRMRGVASAFGHRLDEDVWDHSALDFTDLRAGCSVVYLPPQSTVTGTGVVSRDYDYSTGSLTFGVLPPGKLHSTARPYLLELHPDRGYASVAMVSYDLLSGALDGMNSEGLTVALAMDEELFSQHSLEPTGGPAVGLGVLQVPRLLLDTCATAEEAKDALLQTKQYYEYIPVHYLVADRFGNSFVWEYSHAHNKEFIIDNPNQPLVMTNFSLNRHLNKGRPPSADQARNVCKRYCLLTEQLAAAAGKLSEDSIKRVHKKVDAELPPSADKSRPPVRTFWHALYHPEQRRAQFSFYLHDEPIPDQPDKVRVVRSDYLEFHLAPTEQGQAPPQSDAVGEAGRAGAATVLDGAQQAVVAELTNAGATVKTDGGRVVAVNLDKAQELEPLLRLLPKLPDLAELSIRNPRMNDAGMALLDGLPKLARLQLYSSSVGDDGLKVLKTLPSLNHLPVGGTRVTDAGLVHLKDLTRLEYLGLRGNQVTDVGLVHLRRLTRLTGLDLSQTRITDAGLSHLAEMKRLELLLLTGTNVTDEGLAHIEQLTTITGLFLGGTKVTDAGLVHLNGMSRLTKLNLAKTAVTDEGLAKARKSLPFWITILRDQP
jgi:predicted choloylglycine hydrolase